MYLVSFLLNFRFKNNSEKEKDSTIGAKALFNSALDSTFTTSWKEGIPGWCLLCSFFFSNPQWVRKISTEISKFELSLLALKKKASLARVEKQEQRGIFLKTTKFDSRIYTPTCFSHSNCILERITYYPNKQPWIRQHLLALLSAIRKKEFQFLRRSFGMILFLYEMNDNLTKKKE